MDSCFDNDIRDRLAKCIDEGDDASMHEWYVENEHFIDGRDMESILDDMAYYQETGIKCWRDENGNKKEDYK